jgi:hypothetical protein
MANGSQAAPYILSAVHDIKTYRDSKKYRKIPVGYSATDIEALRPMLQNYLVCHPSPLETLDFFSLNAYEWCGQSSFTQSSYSILQKQTAGYPVPIFFSETGCNIVRSRDFQDMTAILGPQMSDTWSGAIVYEWIQERNDYGLITYGTISGDDDSVTDIFSRKGTPTPISPDFSNLKSRWVTLTPSGVALSEYSSSISSLTAPPCPGSTSGGWAVDPSGSLPSFLQHVTPETSEVRDKSGTPSGTGSPITRTIGPGASASHPNAASQLLAVHGPRSTYGFGMAVAITTLLALGAMSGWWM